MTSSTDGSANGNSSCYVPSFHAESALGSTFIRIYQTVDFIIGFSVCSQGIRVHDLHYLSVDGTFVKRAVPSSLNLEKIRLMQ